MRIRLLYILYIIALHGALAGLAYFALKDIPWAFIISEIVLFSSAALAVYIYSRFMRPIRFVRSGIEAIKDRDFSVKFVPTGKGEVDTLIEVYNLMIDELRAERIRANEQHYFLEKLIEIAPVAIIILDFDGKVNTINQKTLELLFTRPPLNPIGKRLEEIEGTLFRALASLELNQSSTVRTDNARTCRILRSQLMDRGFPRSFFLIEEITSELAASEKKAYGVVIRMMAHEVNNTLGATNSILQSAVNLLPPHSYQPLTDALSIGIERNNRLAVFMRNFADVVRLPQPQRQLTDIRELLSGIIRFFRPMVNDRGILLTFEESGPSILLSIDPGQIEQVIVNVLKNALEACDRDNTIEIIADSHSLTIQNNGQPVSPEQASRLFTPFYTTKPNGQGIGLTLTKEILHNHGFGFSLKTTGEWTRFEVFLG